MRTLGRSEIKEVSGGFGLLEGGLGYYMGKNNYSNSGAVATTIAIVETFFLIRISNKEYPDAPSWLKFAASLGGAVGSSLLFLMAYRLGHADSIPESQPQ